MNPSELATLDATAQADLVRRGEATPRELVDAAIARLSAVNPRINAVIHTQLDEARARAADPALPDGPFKGVPFLMKDIGGPEGGQPNHAGSRLMKEIGFRESADGYLTQKFKAAGLVILGRTNTPELALLPTTEPEAYGPTRNPWNLEHSAGGSSGGAAAAVAAGIVPFANASDGGGSIRGPG
ncbi:amidase, partial [Candidatus Binatia bacterium]|nr:amidase [Candidatus Binatia bacterium]